MKIVDGTNYPMGRLASYVAKEALKGEEIAVVNCNKVIITGSRKNIEENFQARRGRFGSSQKGPIISKSNEKIVKHAIRGMFPNFREGRGREALKRVKCYNETPREFESKQIIKFESRNPKKSVKLESIRK
jgi:large subunit ribosomal protein L13